MKLFLTDKLIKVERLAEACMGLGEAVLSTETKVLLLGTAEKIQAARALWQSPHSPSHQDHSQLWKLVPTFFGVQDLDSTVFIRSFFQTQVFFFSPSQF
jgi:hypothetical protein